MERIKVHAENPEKRVIEKAVTVLENGGVVLIPG